MQSRPVGSESAAHVQRVEYLAGRAVKASSLARLSLASLKELCDRFDQTVEFAALEGRSIAESIGTLCDEEPVFGRLIRGLAFATTPVDERSIQLPVIPKHASRLLRTSDEETSAAELERITSSDPVHAGKLLGAANSARFGSRFEIVSLREAIMRLGIPESRRILLSSCFSVCFASRPLQDLWRHSEAVAGSAYELAQFPVTDPSLDVDAAWIAGLLHDIGRLAFSRLPAASKILELELLAANFPVVYAETLSYGLDHAAMGAKCLFAWDIPASIRGAIALHHRPECEHTQPEPVVLASILCLAEDLVASFTGSVSEDLWAGMRRMESFRRTGLTQQHLDDLASSRNGSAAGSRKASA